jgi:tRNA1Val (adenine37-N6)-methyltransferase
MKVNTDGVLLGAVMTIDSSDRLLLDVGTGTGTIALMAAQRMAKGFPVEPGMTEEVAGIAECKAAQHKFMVEAIDIDEPSASEAAMNFSESPWPGLLNAYNLSLDQFSQTLKEDVRFDLIFSNPPYFEDSLTAPDQRKSTARHTSDGLSYRDIFDFASQRLSENGRVAFVLPSDQEQSLCRYGRMCGLHLFRMTRVRTVPRKCPTRIIAEFSRCRCENPEDMTLTIQSEGKYTQEYLDLMRDFYLFA